MKKMLIILVGLLLLSSCTDPEGATQFLKSQGYINIQITGWDMWAKGEDDWTSTGFIAISSIGQKTVGAVTDKGWLNFGRPRWNLRIWRTE